MIHRESEIIQWGIDRNIIGPTAMSARDQQWKKTREEVNELLGAIVDNNSDEARDAIGDIVVTLILQSQMWGFTMSECIEAAWLEIKDRKGRMVNGLFVKET